MAVSQTDRMGIYRWDSGGDPFTREQMDVSHDNIEDRAAGYNQAGSRPVASASYEGFFHFSGSSVLSYCDGTVWTDVGTLASSSGEIGIIDGTASAGVASSAAKADHTHAIAAGTITETMLDTASVTESKLGSASVTEVKIDALAVTNAKLATDAVTGDKIDSTTTITAASFVGSLNADDLSSGTVSDARLPAEISSNTTGNAATVTVGTSSTNAAYRVPFFTSSSGSLSPKTDAGLTYNPSSNNLTLGNTLTVGGEIYVGSNSTDDSYLRFWDANSSDWRLLYWDNGLNGFYVESNSGSLHEMWHAGNLNFTTPTGVVSTSDALRSSKAANNSVPAIQCGGGSNDDYGMGKSSGFTTLRFFSNGAAIFLASESAFYPTDDGVKNLGLSSSGFRFDNIYATSGTVNTSDERDKTEIADLDLGLDFVNDLRPVSFKWNDRSGYVGTRTHQGFLAQQVKSVLDSHGVDRGMFVHSVPDDEPVGSDENDNLIYGEDRMGLRAHEILPSVVLAIQELTARVEALEP